MERYIADYEFWRANFGDTLLRQADGNGNGVVDGGDYVVWRDNLGRTWLDLASAANWESLLQNVPEPTGLAMVARASRSDMWRSMPFFSRLIRRNNGSAFWELL
jgi:hypothetical protein